VVHGAVISEDAPALPFRRQRVEHRVARRAAQTFANAIGEADDEYVLPRSSKREERPYKAGERVTRQHKRAPPACAIRPPSRQQFEHAGDRIRGALDESERCRIAAEDACDEHGQQRIGRLRCRVSKETRVAK
jgi:hypothetical protein